MPKLPLMVLLRGGGYAPCHRQSASCWEASTALSLQIREEGVKGTVRCDRLDGRGQPELGLLQGFIFQFRAGPSLPGWVGIRCVSPEAKLF